MRLFLVNPIKRITISEIVSKLGINRNTVKVRLRELVKSGLLEQHGHGRAVWYKAR
ncbi:winged helix-turn-helix transcriptional regulator [Candidatus Margulisiibacteriota bacterium]